MRIVMTFLLLFLASISPISAAFSFEITGVNPSSISTIDQEVTVNLNITDLPSDSYFRVAFQKESGSSYFGYIKNNAGSWVPIQSLSGDCTGYFLVEEAASASAVLSLKIGEEGRPPGDYLVKAHRFTATSCSATEATNTSGILLALPTAAPTLTPTDTPAPASSTPKPSSTPRPTATPKPTSSPKPAVTHPPSPSPSVLADTTEVTITVSPLPTGPLTHQSTQPEARSKVAIFIILVGLTLLGISLWLLLRKR